MNKLLLGDNLQILKNLESEYGGVSNIKQRSDLGIFTGSILC
ncbi:hypothetical protein [Thioflexithrix psekupsensis]|nr:hypothetical protein [Thioflexithrix psekupsensis]